MFSGKSILVTGGTGSFGRRFVRTVLASQPQIERVIVFSRDELKQFEMQNEAWPQPEKLRFFLGDVRDHTRLQRALEDVDIVVHAAALKQVPAAEYNPFEAIKTNVLGAQNVIEACLDRGVEHVVALSTDKAAAPVNLYGATKLCSDKLFIAANNFKGKRNLRFSVVRYGNVLGSRGSVVPFFLNRRASGTLPITHPEMTRFNITLDEGVALVLQALSTHLGGETFIPKIPSYRVVDVATAIAPSVRQDIVGIRPGEKLHEDLITPADAESAYDVGPSYVVLPPGDARLAAALVDRGAVPCRKAFHYSSGNNDRWLSVEDIRSLIRGHVDPNFAPL
jgi:UDP-N-acetylglucosamine 4,6-dehydratase (inverting)